jgi:hypothetical protein
MDLQSLVTEIADSSEMGVPTHPTGLVRNNSQTRCLCFFVAQSASTGVLLMGVSKLN